MEASQYPQALKPVLGGVLSTIHHQTGLPFWSKQLSVAICHTRLIVANKAIINKNYIILGIILPFDKKHYQHKVSKAHINSRMTYCKYERNDKIISREASMRLSPKLRHHVPICLPINSKMSGSWLEEHSFFGMDLCRAIS